MCRAKPSDVIAAASVHNRLALTFTSSPKPGAVRILRKRTRTLYRKNAHYGGAAVRWKILINLFDIALLHSPYGNGARTVTHAASGGRRVSAYWAMTDTSSGGGWHDEPPPHNPVPSPLLSPLPALPPPLPRAASAWSNYLRVVGAGCRIALLGRPSLPGLRLEPGLFWVLMATSLLLNCGWSWLAVEAPKQFDLWGLESQAFFFLPLLLASTVLARLSSRPELLWRFAIMMVAAGLLSDTVADLVYQHVLPRLERHKSFWDWAYYAAMQCWTLAIVWRLLSLLGVLRSGARRGLAALAVTALFAVLSWCIPDTDIWEKDYSAEYQQQERVPKLVAEEVFSRQDELPGRPSLYFVAYAPDGEQDVFRKEALYGTRLFAERFGTAQRSLTLVNSRGTVGELPLASALNLDRGLRAIGRKMNPQQDILFLYLTSHGSRDAELVTKLPGLSFTPFNAPRLAQILKDSGIRWKVIVVSACYSGSFINSLKDDHTLVITAARADRTSFGCSDDAEFTYFGRAYLEQALNQTTSFTDAFGIARTLVDRWETRDQEVHSEPQIAKGALIGAQLEQWRATLPPDTPPGLALKSPAAARPDPPDYVNQR